MAFGAGARVREFGRSRCRSERRIKDEEEDREHLAMAVGDESKRGQIYFPSESSALGRPPHGAGAGAHVRGFFDPVSS